MNPVIFLKNGRIFFFHKGGASTCPHPLFSSSSPASNAHPPSWVVPGVPAFVRFNNEEINK